MPHTLLVITAKAWKNPVHLENKKHLATSIELSLPFLLLTHLFNVTPAMLAKLDSPSYRLSVRLRSGLTRNAAQPGGWR